MKNAMAKWVRVTRRAENGGKNELKLEIRKGMQI